MGGPAPRRTASPSYAVMPPFKDGTGIHCFADYAVRVTDTYVLPLFATQFQSTVPGDGYSSHTIAHTSSSDFTRSVLFDDELPLSMPTK